MMTGCCDYVEPCHGRECDGLDEVVQLLPHGRLWNPDRDGNYGAYIKALGHIKTELNKRLCQEWNELNSCTSERLFEYWADLYKFPKCVEQTGEKLCEWLELIYGDCPIGSQGFIRRAIEFVTPGAGITVEFNFPDFQANCWCASNIFCADKNPIVISAPPEMFRYETIAGDYPHEVPDGADPCRKYFVPEVECLRNCVFPFGLGVGYKTNPIGPDSEDIYGVPEQPPMKSPRAIYTCSKMC